MLSRLLILSLLLASAPAAAQLSDLTVADLINARAMGMGGAFRATGTGAESAMGNPAALSLFKAYNVDATGAWDAATKAAFLSSLIRDSVTSQLAAGVGYQLISTGHGAGRQTTHFATIATAFPLAESFSLGVAGHYLGREGPSPASAITVDVGLLARLGQAVTIGVSGHNLVDTQHVELPRYYALSTALSAGAFTLAADLRSELAKGGFRPDVNAGLEYAFGNAVPIRAGYSYAGETQSSFITGGVGFTSEGSGLDFAYRHELAGPSRLLVLSFRGQF